MIVISNVEGVDMKKEKQILALLPDDNHEEIRIIKKPENSFMIHKISTKNGKISDKNILEVIHGYPYQNLILSVENYNVVCVKQEKKFKFKNKKY